MKRIFLTSGLVVCMACPAFADLDADNKVVESPNTGADATCRIPTLEGYNGTSTFTAKWTPTYQTITINSNTGTTATTGGVDTLTPQTLYSVPGTSLVWTGLDTTTGNLTGGNNNAGIGESGLVLSNSPMVSEGISVNYTLNANGGNLGDASSTGDNRPFLGVFDAQNGSTKYIDEDGNLTNAGVPVTVGVTVP